MDKELHANCHKAQSCCGIKIATNLQEIQEMPLYREYSISAKKSSTNSTHLGTEMFMLINKESLGQYVCNHLHYVAIHNFYKTFFNIFLRQ
jgi:hypothetical protein